MYDTAHYIFYEYFYTKFYDYNRTIETLDFPFILFSSNFGLCRLRSGRMGGHATCADSSSPLLSVNTTVETADRY